MAIYPLLMRWKDLIPLDCDNDSLIGNPVRVQAAILSQIIQKITLTTKKIVQRTTFRRIQLYKICILSELHGGDNYDFWSNNNPRIVPVSTKTQFLRKNFRYRSCLAWTWIKINMNLAKKSLISLLHICIVKTWLFLYVELVFEQNWTLTDRSPSRNNNTYKWFLCYALLYVIFNTVLSNRLSFNLSFKFSNICNYNNCSWLNFGSLLYHKWPEKRYCIGSSLLLIIIP